MPCKAFRPFQPTRTMPEPLVASPAERPASESTDSEGGELPIPGMPVPGNRAHHASGNIDAGSFSEPGSTIPLPVQSRIPIPGDHSTGEHITGDDVLQLRACNRDTLNAHNPCTAMNSHNDDASGAERQIPAESIPSPADIADPLDVPADAANGKGQTGPTEEHGGGGSSPVEMPGNGSERSIFAGGSVSDVGGGILGQRCDGVTVRGAVGVVDGAFRAGVAVEVETWGERKGQRGGLRSGKTGRFVKKAKVESVDEPKKTVPTPSVMEGAVVGGKVPAAVRSKLEEDLESIPAEAVNPAEYRRLQVQRLKLQGYELKEIAERLGVTVKRVWDDWDYIRKHWVDVVPRVWEDFLCREVARLDMIFEEAAQGWRRSVEMGIVVNTKMTRTGKPKRVKKGGPKLEDKGTFDTVTVTKSPGDARFLNTMMEAHRELKKLLGADPSGNFQTGPKVDDDTLAVRTRFSGIMHRLNSIRIAVDVGGAEAGGAGGDRGDEVADRGSGPDDKPAISA